MRTPVPLSRRVVVAGVLLALLALLAALPVLAQSTGAANASASSASAKPLSTQDLIEQAYTRGEITAQQRILYLAYAVYDIKKLPAQYHGTAGWYGTAAVAEINHALQNQGTGKATPLSPAVAAELAQLTRPQGTLCNRTDEPNNTESANFRVNYGTVKGGLTIEQYVTALDTAFNVEVTQYTWPKPPYNSANTFNKYPVQVSDLASSGDGNLYGYVTTNGGALTSLVGNNPNTTAVETDAFSTCMVVNDNIPSFTGGDVALGIRALNNTMAHEFVHAIQFGVGDPDPQEGSMWYESTASYAEDEVDPAGHDNYQYLWPLFQQSLVTYPKAGWYSNWPMFRYVAERLGGMNTPGGGEVVYRDFLANVATGQRAIPAYSAAVQSKGGDFNDLFHSFAIAIRFTKKCPVALPYCYSDGDLISARMQNTPIQNDGDVASVGASYTGSITDTYAINYVGLPASGAYSVSVANTAANGSLRASVVADTGDGLTVSNVPGLAGPGQTVTLGSFNVPANTQRVVLVITNQGVTSNDASSATPYTVTVGTPGEGGTPTPPAETPTPIPTATPSATPTPCPEGGCAHLVYLPLVANEYSFHDLPPSLTR